MALQGSGPIWLSEIAAQFGDPAPHWLSEFYRGGGRVPNASINNAIPTAGAIYFSQFYGATNTTSGSWDRTAPGTYTVNVGPHQWVRIRVWGSGGGAASLQVNGAAGGFSRVSGGDITTMTAHGGANGVANGNGGAGGTATGGNESNQSGGDASSANQGGFGIRIVSGGNGASGGAGGATSSQTTAGNNGAAPGGGGGGLAYSNAWGSGGGGGGYCRSLYGASGGRTFTVIVGDGGNGAAGGGFAPGNGANGRVLIEWG